MREKISEHRKGIIQVELDGVLVDGRGAIDNGKDPRQRCFLLDRCGKGVRYVLRSEWITVVERNVFPKRNNVARVIPGNLGFGRRNIRRCISSFCVSVQFAEDPVPDQRVGIRKLEYRIKPGWFECLTDVQPSP